MRKLLNTLFITTPDCYLSLDGNNVVVLKDNERLFRVPVTNLEGIICFNYQGASPMLMKYCTDHNILISFLHQSGRYLASVTGKIKGNVLLRKKQYMLSEDQNFSLNIAKIMIAAKLFNTRYEINRTIRDNELEHDMSNLKKVAHKLKESIPLTLKCDSFQELRGIEGDNARFYFNQFNDMIIQQKQKFKFHGRSRRPPLDNVNAMLSFGYALLGHDIEASLLSVGIDPYVGFLHTDRPGRISLALDIMEELRATIVDRFVLTLINLRQINEKHFIYKENSAVLLNDEGRKVFITQWHKKKNEEIKHPFTKEKIKMGLIPYVQALILSRYLRGEINEYVPFLRR